MRQSILAKTLESEDGVVAAEFLPWLPVMGLVLLFSADAALYLTNSNRIYDAARSVARNLSFDRMNVEQARAYLGRLLPEGYSPTLSVDETNLDDVVLQISVPVSDIAPFGTISTLRGGDFVFQYVMPRETSPQP